MYFHCCSKLVITKRWVTEIVRQRVPGHRADNRERPTTELAVTMSWNDELLAADRAKMLTAGDIRSKCAAVHSDVSFSGKNISPEFSGKFPSIGKIRYCFNHEVATFEIVNSLISNNQSGKLTTLNTNVIVSSQHMCKHFVAPVSVLFYHQKYQSFLTLSVNT